MGIVRAWVVACIATAVSCARRSHDARRRRRRDLAWADVDRDGAIGLYPPDIVGVRSKPGVHSTDPGDSILEAEIVATRDWIQRHVGPGFAAGLVAFAGAMDPGTGRAIPGEPPARVVAPISHDRAGLDAAVSRLSADGSSGESNYAAAIELALSLIRSHRSGHTAKPNRAMILLLGDGFPTLPVGSATVADPGDWDAALTAARAAREADVAIHVIVLRTSVEELPGKNESNRTPGEIAAATGGTYRFARHFDELRGHMSAAAAEPSGSD